MFAIGANLREKTALQQYRSEKNQQVSMYVHMCVYATVDKRYKIGGYMIVTRNDEDR